MKPSSANANRALSFDADGNGAAAAAQLALLSTRPAIVAGDIAIRP